MRSHLKKYLVRAAAIAIVIYAALCLKMWLAPTNDTSSLDIGVQDRHVRKLDLARRREQKNRLLHGELDTTNEEQSENGENQKKKSSVDYEYEVATGDLRNNTQVRSRPSLPSLSLASAGTDHKKYVSKQYTDQLFKAQGPFRLSQSVLGNLTDGADGVKRYAIFPDEDPNSDRIVNQMRYVPLNVLKMRELQASKRKQYYKTILILPGSDVNNLRLKEDNCPVQECDLTLDYDRINDADAVVWMQSAVFPNHQRPKNQIWIIYQLESPYNTQSYFEFTGHVNYTASYRHDSTIVTPYYKFVSFTNVTRKKQPVNYAAGKTKQVAWFVSNCDARNQRLQYANELGRYIGVDIYGSCGDKHCPRAQANSCFQMINKDYKFYLSFENSNCRDYITEKFFLNGLHHNVVPIVMGAHPDDYRRVAPEHSYIHVDDFASAKDLALFLHRLDRNDTLYNEYFEWKGTGEFINTFWWCRLCTMAHAAESEKRQIQVDDVENWWRSPGTCIPGSWRKPDDA